MKRIFCILIAIWTIWILPAQDYDGWIEKAMNAVEKDSLYEAEKYFKNALNTDPANMRNAMLLSNLGTIQRRMGKNKEAIESYTLAINKSPHSVTMLLNRASLYLEMDHLDKAYSDYCNVIDLDRRNMRLCSSVLTYTCVVGNIQKPRPITVLYWRKSLETKRPAWDW